MNKATASVPPAIKEIKLSPADEARFWSKVDKSGGPDACWLWTAGKSDRGYGAFYAGRRSLKASRIAWTLTHGQIPHDGSHYGICVCHNCPGGEKPACCNPAHLFLGTQDDNNRDRDTKGRQAKGATNGNSKLTAEQVIEIRSIYAAGGISGQRLGVRFGVHYSLIHLIIKRKIWKHL